MQDADALFDQRLVGLGIAVGIGLLIGIEREWAENKPVGVRSFALIGAAGGTAALVSTDGAAWVLAAAVLGLALLLVRHARSGEKGGVTTLVAALLVFLIGAAAVYGYWLHAIVLGGVVTLILHWKGPLHGLVDRLGRRDFEIIARFVLLSLVILPVMPDRTFGPYDVFNPFETWMLVVLIVGINLVGFVLFRIVGTGAGAWMAGALGGLISSTATTISYATMSKRAGGLGTAAALIVLVASAVVYPRVLVELTVVAPTLVATIAGPAITFGVVLLVIGGFMQFRQSDGGEDGIAPAEQENPARIRVALTFAALYVLILFAVAFARDYLGTEAIYGVAFLSGLTDVDALTLTVGQSFERGELNAGIAWRAIFLASLSNLLFKVGVAAALGSPGLRRQILISGGLALLVGAAVLVLWP